MMDVQLVARIVLALEALACLWLAQFAWRQSGGREDPLRSAIAALLFCAAAAVMIYGLARS